MRTTVRMERFLWLEDLIGLVEGVLQRLSEREVTVERICRRLSESLSKVAEIRWYKVEVENQANGYASFASSEKATAAGLQDEAA